MLIKNQKEYVCEQTYKQIHKSKSLGPGSVHVIKLLFSFRYNVFVTCAVNTTSVHLPPRDRVHRPWPASYGHCVSALGNIHWTSRCSEQGVTSCCTCTEGFLCRVSSPARPLTTPQPMSIFVSGPRYSVSIVKTLW